MTDTTLIEAAGILLREGLEAILVIAALAAYLTRVGADHRVNALWVGAALAVVASILAAWVFERFFGGAHNDLMEGVVLLVAAVLMFYVSGWLFLKQDPRAWQAYLKTHTDKAVGSETMFAVAALTFLAVFREGAETVLFLVALAKTSGGWSPSMLTGLAVASVALAVLFVVIRRTTLKLPLRLVFLVTSSFLFLMGLKFVGQGLKEFQEQAMIPYNEVPGLALLERIGFNPTWEAISLQLAIALAAILGFVWMRRGETALEAK